MTAKDRLITQILRASDNFTIDGSDIKTVTVNESDIKMEFRDGQVFTLSIKSWNPSQKLQYEINTSGERLRMVTKEVSDQRWTCRGCVSLLFENYCTEYDKTVDIDSKQNRVRCRECLMEEYPRRDDVHTGKPIEIPKKDEQS
jgi:hypothetical protein